MSSIWIVKQDVTRLKGRYFTGAVVIAKSVATVLAMLRRVTRQYNADKELCARKGRIEIERVSVEPLGHTPKPRKSEVLVFSVGEDQEL